jgi:hypothetical protein
MNQIIRELKRQAASEKLAPEQLKGLIRAGYVYRNGDEHFLTDKGRDALAQLRVQPGDGTLAEMVSKALGGPPAATGATAPESTGASCAPAGLTARRGMRDHA